MKKIKIGLDFDGVVAYNPFRVIRAPVAYIKRSIFRVKKLSFYYPKSNFQKLLWTIIHESSVIPAKGINLLRKLVEEELIEAHLITARYSFLDAQLYNWLEKKRLTKLFKTININNLDEQPHLFKEKTISKHKLDFFIEDNLDIVKHLHEKGKTKIYWIYNILDRSFPHPHKFPYLEKALEEIILNLKS